MESFTNDVEATEKILQAMIQHLKDENDKDFQECTKALETKATAQCVMELLTPSLFETESTEALSVLQALVVANSARYLKPASRAVLYEAQFRLSNPSHTMTVSPGLLKVIVAQLNGEDVEVANNASASLLACCRKIGSPLLEPALEELCNSWDAAWGSSSASSSHNRFQNTTISVRCASVFVDIVNALGDPVIDWEDGKATNTLVSMMNDSSDPLLQMSILDLIEKLATTKPMHHGRARWLFTDPVLKPLLLMSGGTIDGSPDPILGGQALRIVAALCSLAHDQGSALFSMAGSTVLEGFHRALHNFEASRASEVDRLAMIDAISSFASVSPAALDLVLQDPVTREAWLSLSVAQPKLKSAVLMSVAMFMDPPPQMDSNGNTIEGTGSSDRTFATSMKVFAALGVTNHSQNPSEIVLSLAQSPLPETRLASYALMKAVSKFGSGARLLLSHPGLFEFLLNRETETTKEGREAKFVVVETIMQSEARGMLAEDIVRLLDRYLQQGPHYMPTYRPELTTDS